MSNNAGRYPMPSMYISTPGHGPEPVDGSNTLAGQTPSSVLIETSCLVIRSLLVVLPFSCPAVHRSTFHSTITSASADGAPRLNSSTNGSPITNNDVTSRKTWL